MELKSYSDSYVWEEITHIHASHIFPDPHKKKVIYSKSEIDEMTKTLLKPLIVYYHQNNKLKYYVTNEDKLFQAYLYTNITEIPCIIKNVSMVATSPGQYFNEADRIFQIYQSTLEEDEISEYFQIPIRLCRKKVLLHEFDKIERKLITKVNLSEDAALKLLYLSPKERGKAYRFFVNGAKNEEAEKIVLHLFETKAKIFIKSIGLFYNSIEKAIALAQKSGIQITCHHEESLGSTQIHITIANEGICSTKIHPHETKSHE